MHRLATRCRAHAVALAALLLLATPPTRAENHYVALAGSHTAPYTNWLTAATNIQAAVDVAVVGETVWVTDGVYRTGTTVTPGATLLNRVAITNDITLQSVNGPDVTFIEGSAPLGSNAVRCVYMGLGRVDGFTLTKGFTRNTGNAGLDQSGGGLFAVTGLLVNCRLRGNTAFYAGGGAMGGSLFACSVTSNSASSGPGGGVYQSTLYNCTVSRNTAGEGGGARSGSLRNCAVWGNSVSGDGGGIHSCDAFNCTITDNSALGGGGGSMNGALYSCVVFYNRASLSPNTYFGDTYHCCLWPPGLFDNGSMMVEPLLLSYTHIAPNSPCVGAGVSSNVFGFDLDGEAWGASPTIGCDEPYAGLATGALSVAIRSESTQAVAGAGVRLIGETIGVPTSNVWQFGDGQSATNTAFVTHAWPAAGTYQVALTVFNASHPTGVTALASMRVLSAEQTAKFVSTNSPHPAPPYNAWSNAAHTIQEAVDAQTLFGGLVWVTNGSYAAGIRATPGGIMSNRVVITNNILVKSVNGPTVTIIRGIQTNFAFNNLRCVFISAGRLEGFTLTGGGTFSGGGSRDLDGCGGGVNSRGGVVSNCEISGNMAYGDGGGANFGTYFNCLFAGNTAWTFSGAVDWGVLFNCTLISNSASGDYSSGGGMGGGSAFNCLLTANSAYYSSGGAYFAFLQNCVLSGNSPDGASLSRLLNCTVAHNGGGVAGSTLEDSIVYYNSGWNISGGTSSHCCTWPDPGGPGDITNQPLFLAPTSSNYRLQFLSPCINAGTNGAWTAGDVDIDGLPRIVGGIVDIGAYESPVDSDADGLSDPWEQHYVGSLTNMTCMGDWDGDGCLDGDEMRAGTNPADSSSLLRVMAMDADTNGAGVVVRWASELGRVYSLRSATNDVDGLPGVLQTNIMAVPPMNTFTDTAPADAFRIYGVQLQPIP